MKRTHYKKDSNSRSDVYRAKKIIVFYILIMILVFISLVFVIEYGIL